MMRTYRSVYSYRYGGERGCSPDNSCRVFRFGAYRTGGLVVLARGSLAYPDWWHADCLDNESPGLDIAVTRCDVCGWQFGVEAGVEAPTYRGQIYCDEACRKHAQRGLTRPGPRPCQQCGQDFTPRRSDARFCSGRCRVAAHRAR